MKNLIIFIFFLAVTGLAYSNQEEIPEAIKTPIKIEVKTQNHTAETFKLYAMQDSIQNVIDSIWIADNYDKK
jgi:hypothetical protein